MMKKIVCAMLCILLVFSLSACGGNVNEVNTHNVESEIYSEEDIAAAIDTIKKEFKSNWNGCTLTEIYYAGDDSSKDHQDWACLLYTSHVSHRSLHSDADIRWSYAPAQKHVLLQTLQKSS